MTFKGCYRLNTSILESPTASDAIFFVEIGDGGGVKKK